MDDKSNKIPDKDADYLNYFYGNVLKSPYFITVSGILNEYPEINFHTDGFYKQISESGYVLAEPPMFTIIDKAIFINSFYSDKIFKIETARFTIAQSIPIVSDYTKIGTHPIQINEGVLGKIQDSITYKEKTAGRIERFLYNTSKKEYYCIVKHDNTVNAYDHKQVPFSVIILDTNLVKIKEYLFDDNQYIPESSLITKGGLMLMKNDTTKSLIKNAKISYSLFSFN